MVDPGRALGGYSPEAGPNDHEADARHVSRCRRCCGRAKVHLDPAGAAAAAERCARARPAAARGNGRGRSCRARRGHRLRRRGSAGPIRCTGRPGSTAGAGGCPIGGSHRRRGHRPAHRLPPRSMPSAAAGSRATRAVAVAGQPGRGGHRGGRHGVIGPGLTVTITDPGVSKDLSDVSSHRCPAASRSWTAICSWWSTRCGSAVPRRYRLACAYRAERDDPPGGRWHPGRQSADQQPIRNSRARTARTACVDVFDRSPALQRLRLLETSYGVGVKVSAGDGLTCRPVRFEMSISPCRLGLNDRNRRTRHRHCVGPGVSTQRARVHRAVFADRVVAALDACSGAEGVSGTDLRREGVRRVVCVQRAGRRAHRLCR